MSAERFMVSDTNPNDSVGGGGCIGGGELKHEDCRGPYVVFYNEESASNISPHVVICSACLAAAARSVDSGNVLAAGERDPEVETTANPSVGDSRADEDDVPEV